MSAMHCASKDGLLRGDILGGHSPQKDARSRTDTSTNKRKKRGVRRIDGEARRFEVHGLLLKRACKPVTVPKAYASVSADTSVACAVFAVESASLSYYMYMFIVAPRVTRGLVGGEREPTQRTTL